MYIERERNIHVYYMCIYIYIHMRICIYKCISYSKPRPNFPDCPEGRGDGMGTTQTHPTPTPEIYKIWLLL